MPAATNTAPRRAVRGFAGSRVAGVGGSRVRSFRRLMVQETVALYFQYYWKYNEPMGKVTADIRVADEVWIGTALLHRENSRAADFTLKEIEARIAREGLADKRPGIYPHLSVHCVANRAPNGGTYRMLFETAPSRRRLFRPGDPYHPKREGGKMVPDRTEIPAKYHPLLDWYEHDG